MVGIIRALWWTLGLRLKSRERIDAENLALRHQLNIVCRSARKRVRLCKSDRLLFIWLYRLWPSVLDSVVTLILAGRTLQSGDYVGAVCGNRRCVRPGHLVAQGVSGPEGAWAVTPGARRRVAHQRRGSPERGLFSVPTVYRGNARISADYHEMTGIPCNIDATQNVRVRR